MGAPGRPGGTSANPVGGGDIDAPGTGGIGRPGGSTPGGGENPGGGTPGGVIPGGRNGGGKGGLTPGGKGGAPGGIIPGGGEPAANGGIGNPGRGMLRYKYEVNTEKQGDTNLPRWKRHARGREGRLLTWKTWGRGARHERGRTWRYDWRNTGRGHDGRRYCRGGGNGIRLRRGSVDGT